MNGWTKAIQFAALVAIGTLAFFLFATRNKASSAPSPQASAQDVYLDKCSVCHAKDGSGNTAKGRKLKVKDVRSPDVQKMSEAEMIDIVAKGKGQDMDGYEKDLGKDMVKNVVDYYRSLAKP
jgi:mono/diheme cytochrome c family protein